MAVSMQLATICFYFAVDDLDFLINVDSTIFFLDFLKYTIFFFNDNKVAWKNKRCIKILEAPSS